MENVYQRDGDQEADCSDASDENPELCEKMKIDLWKKMTY